MSSETVYTIASVAMLGLVMYANYSYNCVSYKMKMKMINMEEKICSLKRRNNELEEQSKCNRPSAG